MEAFALLIVIAIVCLIAALVGGNVRFPGVHIPVTPSKTVRSSLAAIGVMSAVAAAFVVMPREADNTPAPPAARVSSPSTSDPSDPAVTETGPTKASFIAAADAICRRAGQDLAKLKDSQSTFNSPAEYLLALLEVMRLASSEEAGLEVPIPDRQTLSAMNRARQQWIEAVEAAADADAGGDTAAFQASIAAAERADSTAKMYARQYGLKVCPP